MLLIFDIKLLFLWSHQIPNQQVTVRLIGFKEGESQGMRDTAIQVTSFRFHDMEKENFPELGSLMETDMTVK